MSNHDETLPRYTRHALPPHRFLPGDRRPASIPALPDPPALTPPDRWRDCAAYLYGCDLYNHGYWWESHEIWEDLWRQAAAQPEPRLQYAFLQGLIQIAACAIKRAQQRQRGLTTLLRTSNAHLLPVINHVDDAPFMGLPVRRFRDEVQAYYLASVPPDEHEQRFPRIELAI